MKTMEEVKKEKETPKNIKRLLLKKQQIILL